MRLAVFFAFASLPLFAGCSTLPNGRRWGQDATLTPGYDRISRAAVRAFCSPGTWAPAVGALAFSIDDFDEKTSDWAAEHNPVFGSRQGAQDASDMLRDGLNYWKYATLLATPGGSDPAFWVLDKTKGLLVEVAAQKVNIKSKQWITANAARLRPDLSSHTSFPSGHANNAFGSAALANLNLDSIPMNTTARHTLQTATWTTAMGTGWARIEANKHYPSDILAAAALANLLTTFIHDAFLGLPEESVQVGIVPTDEGFELQATWRF